MIGIASVDFEGMVLFSFPPKGGAGRTFNASNISPTSPRGDGGNLPQNNSNISPTFPCGGGGNLPQNNSNISPTFPRGDGGNLPQNNSNISPTFPRGDGGNLPQNNSTNFWKHKTLICLFPWWQGFSDLFPCKQGLTERERGLIFWNWRLLGRGESRWQVEGKWGKYLLSTRVADLIPGEDKLTVVSQATQWSERWRNWFLMKIRLKVISPVNIVVRGGGGFEPWWR